MPFQREASMAGRAVGAAEVIVGGQAVLGVVGVRGSEGTGFGATCKLFKYVLVEDLFLGEFAVLGLTENVLLGLKDCPLLDLKGDRTALFFDGGSVHQRQTHSDWLLFFSKRLSSLHLCDICGPAMDVLALHSQLESCCFCQIFPLRKSVVLESYHKVVLKFLEELFSFYFCGQLRRSLWGQIDEVGHDAFHWQGSLFLRSTSQIEEQLGAEVSLLSEGVNTLAVRSGKQTEGVYSRSIQIAFKLSNQIIIMNGRKGWEG